MNKSSFSDFDSDIETGIRQDLSRLARFGANLADAHSCFIFLPAHLPGDDLAPASQETELRLASHHSLTNDILSSCRIVPGNGLIGWVSKHGRSIHVSPFERDSRTLGTYSSDQELKSFIGIPIPLACPARNGEQLWGVLACDSRKSFAFSKLQGKLLEELAGQIASILQLHFRRQSPVSSAGSWQNFLAGAIRLSESLGRESLEILRLKLRNFERLETELGTPDCLQLIEQIYRLIRQAIPAHFPLLVLSNGDILIALDVMASSFYESRIQAICAHVGSESRQPVFEFLRRSFRDKKYRSASIERLVTDSTLPAQTAITRQEKLYEYRRA